MNDQAAKNGHDQPDISVLEAETELVPLDADVSGQIATAKRFPRSVVKARARAMEMATLDEETAASCFYNLPRSGKEIAGPSARLAEIVASAWGNIRFGAKVIGHDGKEVRAQGMCWDLENNAAFSVEVRRRITDRNGRTFNDDMIAVTGNAANSIAMRNAVLKIVPGVLWKPVYEAARQVAFGDASTLGKRRQQAVDYFAKLGVSLERILAAVGKTAIEEVGLDDLQALTGLKTAIKEGDTTIEEAFPIPGVAGGDAGKPRPQRRTEPQQTATAQAQTVAAEPAKTTPAAATPAAASNVRELPTGSRIEKKGEVEPKAEPEKPAAPEVDFAKVADFYAVAAQYQQHFGKSAAFDEMEKRFGSREPTGISSAQLDELLVAMRDAIETK